MRKPRNATEEGFETRGGDMPMNITHTLTAGQDMDQSESLREGDFVTLRKDTTEILVDGIERSADGYFAGTVRSFPGLDRKTLGSVRLGDAILFRQEHVFSVVRTINLGKEL
ncbi:MAG: hypothetical protein ACOWWM_05620 [Desulfobacterales bacterium]